MLGETELRWLLLFDKMKNLKISLIFWFLSVSVIIAKEKVVRMDELAHQNGIYYLEHEGKIDQVYTVSYTFDGEEYFSYGMPEFWQLNKIMKIPLPGFQVEGKEFQLLVKEFGERKLPTTENSKAMYIVR